MEMTTEQRREYMRERERARREQMRKERIRKQKRRKQLIFVLELLCIFGMLTFLIGKNIGEKAHTSEKEQLAVSERDVVIKEMAEQPEPVEVQNSTLQKDILLVNKNNKLPEDYEVELVTLEDGVNRGAKEAYGPLCDMLRAGRKEGLVFEICSSYRSVERQQELFDEDMNLLLQAGYSYSRAYEEVAKETMPPGYSEHSTGLAFDIVAYDYQMLDAGQEDTDENKWLREHCAEYGFILRYPKGKEEITQISYESWHFRYVGVESAKYITENGLTLEEYLEL